MWWLKLLFVYPTMVLFFYGTSGRNFTNVVLCIVMYMTIQLSLFLLKRMVK